MNDLLKAALPMAEILIIKRDFDLLRKVATQLKPETQVQLTPYIALFCYEVIEYLNKRGHTVEIDQTSKYTIKDVRQKAKFFDLSINKLLKSIINVDKLQNDYFISLMHYPELGGWNVHDNIGIFYDNERNIVGNSHYTYYVFQDEKMISNPAAMSGHEIQGKEIHAFAFDMGRIIGSITSALSQVSDFMVADINTESIVLYHQDFNTNRCGIKGNEEYKVIRLFLLHLLSSIGFILYVMKKAIIRESGLLLRFEYITYHYALMRLEGIKKYCNNSDKVDDPNLLKMLNSIDCSNSNGLRKSEFRNCMMHFGLFDDEGNQLIEETKIDFSIPFCGLIESHFGMTYDEYKSRIEEQLYIVSESIKDYMDFELQLNIDDK